ncbi:hypothetical protein [Methylobacterium longum]|nr:hypothetical protein [Methylobacterium longum]
MAGQLDGPARIWCAGVGMSDDVTALLLALTRENAELREQLAAA